MLTGAIPDRTNRLGGASRGRGALSQVIEKSRNQKFRGFGLGTPARSRGCLCWRGGLFTAADRPRPPTVLRAPLFRQGCMLYDLIPNMPEHRLRPLIKRYAKFLKQSRVASEIFAIV